MDIRYVSLGRYNGKRFMTSKEELERVRLSNRCTNYGNSFTQTNFFKLTFDSYTDIVKIINSLFDSENYELAYQVMV